MPTSPGLFKGEAQCLHDKLLEHSLYTQAKANLYRTARFDLSFIPCRAFHTVNRKKRDNDWLKEPCNSTLNISRLDYINANLVGLPACSTKPLQIIFSSVRSFLSAVHYVPQMNNTQLGSASKSLQVFFFFVWYGMS